MVVISPTLSTQKVEAMHEGECLLVYSLLKFPCNFIMAGSEQKSCCGNQLEMFGAPGWQFLGDYTPIAKQFHKQTCL